MSGKISSTVPLFIATLSTSVSVILFNPSTPILAHSHLQTHVLPAIICLILSLTLSQTLIVLLYFPAVSLLHQLATTKDRLEVAIKHMLDQI